MRLFSCAVVVWASMITSLPARGDNKDVARQAYAEGTRRYDLNDFGAALEAFKRAYLAYEEPAFLFNIAQCYRQLGNKAEAVKFYRSYLRKVPDAQNRTEVERLITSLDNELAQEKASAAPPLAPAPAPPAPTPTTAAATALTTSAPPPARHVPVYKKWWLWTIVGVVAAGAAAGVAVAVTSQRTESSFMPVVVTR